MNLLKGLLPETIVLTGIIFLLILHILSRRKVFFYVFGTIFLSLAIIGEVQGEVFKYQNWVQVTGVSRLLSTLISISSILSLLLFWHSGKRRKYIREIPFFILCANLGLMVLVKSSHLFIAFLSLEFISFIFYILLASFKEFPYEGAVKYFILGSLSTLFFLSGLTLIYGDTGNLSYAVFSTLLKPSPLFVTGIILLFAGIAFKLVFVPFHMWTPDVFESSPFPFAAYISVTPKIGVFGFFLILSSHIPFEQIPIAFFAFLTMTLGNFAALIQKNIKRLLAYSTVAHSGYILIGFLSQKEFAISAILFYISGYLFMQTGAFAFFQSIDKEDIIIENLKGLGKVYLFWALLGSVFLISLLGFPPTVGFTAKFFIFTSGVSEGHNFLVLWALITTAVSAFYYLRLAYTIFIPPNGDFVPDKRIYLSKSIGVVLFLTGLSTALMGIFPQELLRIFSIFL